LWSAVARRQRLIYGARSFCARIELEVSALASRPAQERNGCDLRRLCQPFWARTGFGWDATMVDTLRM